MVLANKPIDKASCFIYCLTLPRLSHSYLPAVSSRSGYLGVPFGSLPDWAGMECTRPCVYKAAEVPERCIMIEAASVIHITRQV